MKKGLVVIYAAANLPEAHLLKTRLEEHGIRATVTNETLSAGAGSEVVGWATLPRVMVERQYAIAARRIAMEYDRSGAQQVESQLPLPECEEEMARPWPRCPECGAPRITSCPICKSTGTFFPESDPEYIWGIGLNTVHDDETSAAAKSCGGTCSCGKPPEAKEGEVLPTPGAESDPVPTDQKELDHEEDQLVLMCPMCDEPFLPAFPKTCAWCGHEFEDGVDIPNPEYFPPEEIGPRVAAISLGIFALLGGVVFYFYMLVR